MDATYYAVNVQIGGRDRSLVCGMEQAEELHKLTGKNLLAGENILQMEGGITPSRLAEIFAILLRVSEPQVSASDLKRQMEFCRFPEYLESIAHVLAGPRYKKLEEQPVNPPEATDQ
jgi:hypothetical protein